jgi:hypothetical protein
MTTSDASARITLVETPIASPACCVVCGKAKHPLGFAATDNLDFEFYGTVYFCADCVGDYARVFGYLSKDQYESITERLEAQDKELAILRRTIILLENTVDSLTDLRSLSTVPDDHHGSDDGVSVVAVQGELEIVEDAPSSGAGDEHAVSKPGSKSRSNDVHDTTEFLNSLGI